MPGFIDSHVHFIFGGLRISQVSLKDARDEAEFAARIARKAKTLGPQKWILGGSWDETNWPGSRLPSRGLIDSVTAGNPVCVERYDGHEVLANSLALKLAGITRHTPDPPGGLIVRDSATGEPTGILKDTAVSAMDRIIPRPTWDELEAALRAGLAEARRYGVTSVHDMYLGRFWGPNDSFSDLMQVLRRADLEGWLTCRFYVLGPIDQWKDQREQPRETRVSAAAGSDFLRTGAVKGFADGSIGSRTAWFHEDYSDQPGYAGLPRYSRCEMESMVRSADAAGLQIALHAIGDRANSEVLDIYEQVGGQAASGPQISHRARSARARPGVCQIRTAWRDRLDAAVSRHRRRQMVGRSHWLRTLPDELCLAFDARRRRSIGVRHGLAYRAAQSAAWGWCGRDPTVTRR